VLHRDLKPENVMRRADGAIKILDFGLARIGDPSSAHAGMTEDGTRLGTPSYMSPEQLRGQPVDMRSDLFALGVLIHELATGRHPFVSADGGVTSVAILEGDPPNLTASLPIAIGERQQYQALETLIRGCLRKSASERYRSAREIIAALELIRSGAFAPAPAAAPRHWWWRFHQTAVIVVYSAVVASLFRAVDLGPEFYRFGVVMTALTAALCSVTLRLHLWFALRHLPRQWEQQRRQTGGWVRAADLLFLAAQVIGATIALSDHRTFAMLLFAAAVVEFLTVMIIEPATTRAAFE